MCQSLPSNRTGDATEKAQDARDGRKQGRSKYGNVKTRVGVLEFASKREAARYQELLLMEAAGVISGLRCQPIYTLQAAFRDRQGKRQMAIRYIGDFEYAENGRTVVEDVKGTTTAVFALKAKLFKARFPDIELRIVK